MARMQRIASILLFGVYLVTAHLGHSRPVDLSAPKNSIGAANSRGYVELWREVDEIDLEKDFILPLRFKFSSEKGVKGIFGEGFWCPLIESYAVLLRPTMMKVNLPCGKALFMRRDRKEKNRFQTLNQEWTGILTGRDFNVVQTGGLTLNFIGGRLVSLTTEAGRKLKWTFKGKLPTGIYEGANALLKVETRVDKIEITVDSRRHIFSLGKRPNFNVLANQVVIEGFSPCLISWHSPNQRTEQFTFALTNGQIPNLTFVDREQKEILYTWDAATGHIQTETGWIYQIISAQERFALPKIIRSTPDGQKEGISIDNTLGIYTKQNLDGTETITYTIHEPGPAYGKTLKRVRRERNVETSLYSASYNETGQLVRLVDEKGFITNFEYDEKGEMLTQLTQGPVDQNILKDLATKEQQLLNAISLAKNNGEQGYAIEKLGFFYIYELGNPDKAIALLNSSENFLSKENRFNIKFHSIRGNRNLSTELEAHQLMGLIKDHPDQRTRLESIVKAMQP